MKDETLGSFFSEAKQHAQDWLETRISLYKLKIIKQFSKAMGNAAWLIVSLFLFFLLAGFAGLTAGFWLSSRFGDYTTGFGLVALAILFMIALISLFKKKLFINPVIKKMIAEFFKDDNYKNNGKQGNN